jgi:hypothetical protein
MSPYFSSPSETLDPHLFDGDRLKPRVRNHIMTTLGDWFTHQGFKGMSHWLHIWLAGSGITNQYGNGDLDVLFGVDMTRLASNNQQYRGLPESALSAGINEALKKDVWPGESHTNFGGSVYEITYFLNPGTGSDISRINPYAAYDVVGSEWTVRPPVVAADPRSQFPRSWFDAADSDHATATALTDRYNQLIDQLGSSQPGTPGYHDAGARLHLVVGQATALFEDIHTGRRAAFSAQGHGYGDYSNFRWQRSKETGAVQKLHELTQVGSESRKQEETTLYGAPIIPADEAIRRAMNTYWNR